MPGPAAILKQLHHLRQHSTDLETRIEQAPKQLGIQQKKLANQEEAFKAAQELLKRIMLDIREKEGAVKATQTQIKKYEQQLESAANKKEYDTLKAEMSSPTCCSSSPPFSTEHFISAGAASMRMTGLSST